MSEIYDAIIRIQELEKQVQSLTKRAEAAEYSAKALRANNKDLETELRGRVKAVPVHIPTIVFATRHTVAQYDTEYGNYIQESLMARFKNDLAEALVKEGYLKDLTVHTEENPRERTVTYRLEGKLNITK